MVRLAVALAWVLAAAAFAPAQAALVVSPDSLDVGTVTLKPGQASGTYSFDVSVSGGPAPVGDEKATFVASADRSWITVDPATGDVPGAAKVKVTVQDNMSSGTHTGTVTFTSGLDPAETGTVTVTVDVVRQSDGPLVVSPTSVNVGTVRVLPNQAHAPFTFSISVSGGPVPAEGESATYVASTDASWLTVSPANGSVPGTLVATVTVSETLMSGTYTGNVRVFSGLDPSYSGTVQVQVTVERVIGDLLVVSPTEVEVVVAAEGSARQTFPVQVENADPTRPFFTWSAQPTVDWLRAPKDTGSGNETVSVTVDPQRLIVNGDEGTAEGQIIFRSNIHEEAATLTVRVRIVPSTELTVFPSRLFWSVEKFPDFGGLFFEPQTLQVFAGTSGWSASYDAPFLDISAMTSTGEPLLVLVSDDAYGRLEVTPDADLLENWDYGVYDGVITVSDRLSQFYRKIPVTVEIRRPGEPAGLPIPTPEFSQISPYYVLIETADAGLLDFDLHVPKDLAYYPGEAQCLSDGGQWLDPDGVPGNLDEYCSLNQRAYVLIALPEMFPGDIYALTPKVSSGLALAFDNGVPTPGSDDYAYADGPVPSVPFGPFQPFGLYGRAIISMRVGATLAGATEVQRVQINIRTLDGTWRVTETYNGTTYVYDDADLLVLDRDAGRINYTGTWGTIPVTVTPGDGRTFLYRLAFSEGGVGYWYEILSLSGNELKGRWQLSSEGGSSGWETFQAQRLVWPFFP